ncbi:hypothetical protein HPB51_000724 [Rhipicephalus microplus]|uniref:Tick transposon n=1 Tax=Rhipicephalus microplus TaxID=6941 RepID=A0A9J6EVE6_RHIMP|nr:hypothetical protein HPB51_000724 [Rhipicephalus microplus]
MDWRMRQALMKTVTVVFMQLKSSPSPGAAQPDTAGWRVHEDVVHENPTLRVVDKFAYLRSALTGPATAAIGRLPASYGCCEDARANVIARFANKDIIFKDHVEQLIDSLPIRSTADVLGLRHCYDNIETNIRGIRALKITKEPFTSDVYRENRYTGVLPAKRKGQQTLFP